MRLLFKPPQNLDLPRGLLEYLTLLNNFVHKLAGSGENTLGFGTYILNRKWPRANVNSDGTLNKVLQGYLLGVYDRQVDTTSTTNTTYSGYAIAGSSTANPVWVIIKTEEVSTGVFESLWADGDELFDNIWNNRTSLNYEKLEGIL